MSVSLSVKQAFKAPSDKTPRLIPQSHFFPTWRPRSVRHTALRTSSPNTLSSCSRNMCSSRETPSGCPASRRRGCRWPA
ncbi:hypothetical protein H8959_017838 [Pygathrix nigripes]